MHFDPVLILELAALGLATGFMAGLLGIGGGMLIGPFMTLIMSGQGVPADLAVKMAIATSMATIMFTSISSVRAHHKRGAVRWDIVKGLAPGIVIGGAIGSMGIFALLKGTTLALIFATFIGFSATQMFLDKKPKPGNAMPGTVGMVGAGGVIGLISGLVGAGGGFISVPFMVAHNVAIINAVATSAALGFPIALANAVGYSISGQGTPGLPAWSLGFIWLPALLVIASCSVLTAPLGAKLAHSLPVAKLKRVFAGVLYALAAYMLWKGLHG
ncbi:sulfite exporter TauE/SafE family protein [Rhodoferax saidenbachensis]|uniref:Probable membrane transporter protein n=1 Tax=Rhodoferax saidenbachensis TaxID=1484693 RepID=A0A1P8K9L5_9BURK|nr:sulfite exporter TauE/SafE family protein [Rhodoferax saidenbachensis]APW42678.1 anion permease [Rhodoferax saidenbachensis]